MIEQTRIRETPADPGQLNELLGTKLEVPALKTQIVQRERLTSLLEKGVAQQVCLIVAPAGYGKTTLLGEWLASSSPSGRRVAWVTLDRFDNSPPRFWSYIGSALQKISPQFQFDSHSFLIGGYDPHNYAWLNRLINGITQIKGQICLVLDDYHTITDESTHRSLAYLLDHQPKNLHILIASRTIPPIPLSRIRGQGQLLEVTSEDLAFTLQEEQIFVSSVTGLEINLEQTRALMAATQGWIAGLRLATLSVQNQYDIQELAARLPSGNAQIFSYLVDEVLSQQEPEIQDFLLKTSILDELSGPFCDALLERENSWSILERIERASLFITQLDEFGHWYRFHPLFTEALRLQLERRVSPDTLRELHNRAHDWLLTHGYLDKAVSHALAAGNLESAAEIVEKYALQALSSFDLTRLLHWIKSFPNELISKRPRLGIYATIANMLLGRFDLVEPMLQLIEKSLSSEQSQTEEESQIRWDVAALRASLACLQGNFQEGIPQILWLKADPSKEGAYLYGSMNYRLGEAYHSIGDMEAAVEAFSDARRIASDHHETINQFNATLGLAQVLKDQGSLRQAEEMFRQALDLALQNKLGAGSIASCRMSLVEIDLERMDVDPSDRRYVQEVVDQFDHLVLGSWVWENLVLLPIRLAKYFLAQRDFDTAEYFLGKAGEFSLQYDQTSYHIASTLIDVQIQIWVGTGRLADDGERLLREKIASLRLIGKVSLSEQMAKARIFLLQNEPARAVAVLNDLTSQYGGKGQNELLMRIDILSALAYHAAGQDDHALQSIEQALSLGIDENYRWIFVREGQPVWDLLTEWQALPNARPFETEEDDHLSPYIESILKAYQNIPVETLPMKRPATTVISPLYEPLSDRETEVLRMLVQGKTVKEIGIDLVLSVNTVKNHVKSIYRKLDIHTRKQLLDQARTRGLL